MLEGGREEAAMREEITRDHSALPSRTRWREQRQRQLCKHWRFRIESRASYLVCLEVTIPGIRRVPTGKALCTLKG